MELESEYLFLGGRVVALVGDVTRQNVDAVVNAANATLLGGGGVDGAIHDAGGSAILEECRQIRRTRYPHGLPTGEAVITTGGNLPAKNVIHTVGPIYGRKPKEQALLLANCYKNSIALAAQNQLNSIAFPSISTGAFGYPREEAAAISSDAIKKSLQENPSIQIVKLVFFQLRDLRVFLQYQDF